jgi:ABC-type antimicrobial peptide transport system permease subunit
MRCLLLVSMVGVVPARFAQSGSTPPAVPVEPIAAILDAFRTHDVVAVTDPHGNVQVQTFLLSLVRDPRFPAAVNDIVIETASARYQDAIDRFVRGDELPRDALRKAWEDHTVANSLGVQADLINGRLLSERLLATLGGFFAIVALMLAAVGVYGLLAHLVARRVPEIGVRLALGARPKEILRTVLRENLLLAIIGSGVGIATAAAGMRVLEGLLFGVSATDIVNLVSAALILVLVSLAAAVVPARRAASVDPLVAPRCE